MATFTDYMEHLLQMAGKLFLGQGHTDVVKRPLEERERFDPTEPLPTHIILNSEEIWGHLLPGTPPLVDDAEIIVHKTYPPAPGESGAWSLAQRTDVAGNKCWIATINGGAPGGELDPRLENWIPAKYGKLWEIVLCEDNGGGAPGAVIPATHAVGWLFDWQSGTLTFEVDPSTLGLVSPFWIKGYRYVGPSVKDVIDGIAAGASITVEDSVPVPFPGVNIVRFGPNFTITDLGGGRVSVSLAAASTWPWPFRDLITAPASGVPGVPTDYALVNPVSVPGTQTFVYMEGVKLLWGVGKDYIFPNPNTLRLLNIVGRPIVQIGMEIEVFYG